MYSKTFALDNYFMHVPELLLDAGEQLLKEHALEVREQAPGYWIMSWPEAEAGETEVSVGRKNVKAYSCDCNAFLEKKMCKHVAAALILIFRRVEKRRSERKTRKSAASGKLPRIQLKNIVRKLSDSELRGFLLEQAAKNPLLAGELKAQYAHKIELADEDQKYFQVIKNYASALTQGKLTEPKFKKLGVYLNNLIQHGEDLCSTKNYREAGLILQGLLKFLAINIQRNRNLDWSELSAGIHMFGEKIFSEVLAPDYQKELISKLRSIYLEHPYTIQDHKANLFSQLFLLSIADQEVIYQDAKNYLKEHPGEDLALRAVFTMAATRDDVSQIHRLIDRHVHRLNTVRQLVSVLREENPEHVRGILFYLMGFEKGQKCRNWAFEQWLDEETNNQLKAKYLIEFISRDGRIDQLANLRKISGDHWKRNYQDLIDEVKKQGDKKLLVNIMVFNDDRTALLDLLRKEEGEQLLLESATFLYRIEPDFIQEKLEEIIRNHLQHHVGYQSGEFILNIFNRLFQIDLHHLADGLFAMIIREFPERKHLIKYIKEEVV
ncbi:MAG: SWIM zinc finger family protein [Saprospiraceae bacterium]|nr:SWIM zinc finger family protein [Saprospiraceae bacterium]